MQAAKQTITAIGMDTIPSPELVIDYIRAIALQVIETEGGFIFDMPENVARGEFTSQIGYQAAILMAFCVADRLEVEDIAEGLSADDVNQFCPEQSEEEKKELLEYIKS